MTTSESKAVSHDKRKIAVRTKNCRGSLNGHPCTVKIIFICRCARRAATAPSAAAFELLRCRISGRSFLRSWNISRNVAMSAKPTSRPRDGTRSHRTPSMASFSGSAFPSPQTTTASNFSFGNAVAKSKTYRCAPPQFPFVTRNKILFFIVVSIEVFHYTTSRGERSRTIVL